MFTARYHHCRAVREAHVECRYPLGSVARGVVAAAIRCHRQRRLDACRSRPGATGRGQMLGHHGLGGLYEGLVLRPAERRRERWVRTRQYRRRVRARQALELRGDTGKRVVGEGGKATRGSLSAPACGALLSLHHAQSLRHCCQPALRSGVERGSERGNCVHDRPRAGCRHHPCLEAAAQRRVERVAWKRRHGQPKGHDSEVGVDAHQVFGRVVGGGDAVVGRVAEQKSAVLQRHLAILEQVVQRRQHVAFGLLDPVENQQPPVHGGTHRGRVEEERVASRQLAPLLEVALGGVSRDRDVFHLAVGQLAERLHQSTSRWAR
mmetsp:Transcript_68529/g.190572  ORF Transcript_68529/g.190572 Transcript_68529/m.190572 type:complete len:321 (+) Transcript_68529:468-1430(+)